MDEGCVVDNGGPVALSRRACVERELRAVERRDFHRKTISLAQKALTDNKKEGYDSEQVTKTVINGVWEWASPRFAVW